MYLLYWTIIAEREVMHAKLFEALVGKKKKKKKDGFVKYTTRCFAI